MVGHEILYCSCPLCGLAASYYEIDHGERHYFKCPSCTKFIITQPAEKRLRAVGSAPSDFSAAAKEATTKDDDRVLEVRYSFGGAEPTGFSLEVVNKSNYRGI